MQNKFLLLLSWLFLVIGNVSLAQDVLPADEVFIPRISSVDDKNIIIDIDIKEGYYLYRERFFSVKAADNSITLGDVTLSEGVTKTDPFSGSQSIWVGGKHTAQITIAYENPNPHSNAVIKLKYQGCHKGVICYPPTTTPLSIDFGHIDSSIPANGKAILQTSPPGKWSTTSNNRANGIVFGKPQKSPLLSEEEAFPFSAEVIDSNTLSLQWLIADGYYLYRDKIHVLDDSVNNIIYSESTTHNDDFFGEQHIYRDAEGIIQLYFSQPFDGKLLNIQFQGCADQGVCYPLMQRRITWENGKILSIDAVIPETSVTTNNNTPIETSAKDNSQHAGSDWVDQFSYILNENIWLGVGLLLVAGLALSFTPCVLPMLPILLGIITNQQSVTRPHAALLSIAYSLGVASMMALFGLVVAKTGINIQVVFQQPLWLIIFAAIFVLMGLAMLGVFSVAMPNGFQNKVHAFQSRFQHANPINLFIVGALSTLVVGPCVAPPLIAILTFISTTNDSLLGALYLFSLGLGMSLPLVVFATISTSIPKTGSLSRLVTRLFAMLMFGVGLWLLSRLLPGAISLSLWGIFMLAVGILVWKSSFVSKTANTAKSFISVIFFVIGIVWLTGGLSGHSNPFKPFHTSLKLPFKYVTSIAELNAELKISKKPVMFDLYADWCVSCKEMEHLTFTNQEVIESLDSFTLLKLNMTKNTKENREILAEFGLIGPPALLFFQGAQELREKRNIGMISAAELIKKLQSIQIK